MSTQQILLCDKQHGLPCSQVQSCIAEPHMKLASLYYKAHEWPWPGAEKGSNFVCNSLCQEAIALAFRLTSIHVVHGADTAHHFEDY